MYVKAEGVQLQYRVGWEAKGIRGQVYCYASCISELGPHSPPPQQPGPIIKYLKFIYNVENTYIRFLLYLILIKKFIIHYHQVL